MFNCKVFFKLLLLLPVIGLQFLSFSICAEDLDVAWRRAIKENYIVKSRLDDIEAAKHEYKAASSANLPVVALNAAYTAMDEPSTSKISGTPMQVAEQQFLSYGANLTVPLYTGGKIESIQDISNINIDVAQYDYALEVDHLKIDIAKSYINILRLQRLLAVSKSHLKSLEVHYKDIESLAENEMAAKTDLLSVRVALADAKQNLLQVETSLSIAKSQYNKLLGRGLDADVDIEEISVEMSKASLTRLINKALEERKEIRKLKNIRQINDYRLKEIKSSLMPQVAVSGGYNYTENKYQEYEGQWSVSLGVNWTLYDSGITSSKKLALASKTNALEFQIKDLEEGIRLQVRSAWLDQNQNAERIKVAEKAIDEAEENLKATKAKYQADMASNSEVLDAETQRERAHTNYFNAVYDRVLSTLNLRYVCGVL